MREKKMSLTQTALLKCVWFPLVLHIALLSGPTHSLNIYNQHNLCRTQGTQSTKRDEEVITEILMDPHLLGSEWELWLLQEANLLSWYHEIPGKCQQAAVCWYPAIARGTEVHPSCPHYAWASAEGGLMCISPEGSISPLFGVAFPSCQWAHSFLM